MNSPHTQYWHLPKAVKHRALERCLPPGLSLRADDETPQTLALWDDPDWKIWHSGALFVFHHSQLGELHARGDVIAQTGIGNNARFWWDFPAGELREALKKRIKLRALEKKRELEISHKRCRLLNEDAKTVARLTITRRAQPDNDNAACYVVAEPLRGYHKEFKTLVSSLNSLFGEPAADHAGETSHLRRLFVDAGVDPARERQRFGISGSEPAESAVRKMSLILVERARRQREGIIADTDTEFLHHYRVNLRKARSLINLMKQTLLPEKQGTLKENLARLAGATNSLRDLDVFLLNETTYRTSLPDFYSGGLDELFQWLAREREHSFRDVSAFMQSRDYDDRMDQVCAELAGQPDFHTVVSSRPVIGLAGKKILRRYHTIRRRAADIDEHTPDSEVHGIRIDGKKLRYLMELFSEIFAPRQLGPLIKRLRKLQNVLGRFNDYSVQKDFLGAYTDAGRHSPPMVAAVNGLVAVLHQRQLAERQKVEAALAGFLDDSVKTAFDRLLD